MDGLVMVGGFFAFVAFIIIMSIHFDRKRTKAFQAVAASMNFTFSDKASTALLGPAHSFHLFSQGHSKKLKRVMKGVANEIDVKIFDYQYTTGHGKNSHTYIQTVILFTSDRLQLPEFTMRPENVFHKIGGAFGYQDIDFDRNPAFSKNYLLRGPSERSIRETFTQDVLSYFESQKGICVEGKGNIVVFYRASKKVPPHHVATLLREGFSIFGLFAQAVAPAPVAPQQEPPHDSGPSSGGVKIRMPT